MEVVEISQHKIVEENSMLHTLLLHYVGLVLIVICMLILNAQLFAVRPLEVLKLTLFDEFKLQIFTKVY